MDSNDDDSWANINVDQLGEAVGLVYQAEEPLNTIGKIDKRDENRWSMNPASAEDFDKSSKENGTGEHVKRLKWKQPEFSVLVSGYDHVEGSDATQVALGKL